MSKKSGEKRTFALVDVPKKNLSLKFVWPFSVQVLFKLKKGTFHATQDVDKTANWVESADYHQLGWLDKKKRWISWTKIIQISVRLCYFWNKKSSWKKKCFGIFTPTICGWKRKKSSTTGTLVANISAEFPDDRWIRASGAVTIGWLESWQIETKVGPPNLEPIWIFSYLPLCQDAKKPGRLRKIYLNFLVGGEPTKTPFEKNVFFSQIGSEIFPPHF